MARKKRLLVQEKTPMLQLQKVDTFERISCKRIKNRYKLGSKKKVYFKLKAGDRECCNGWWESASTTLNDDIMVQSYY